MRCPKVLGLTLKYPILPSLPRHFIFFGIPSKPFILYLNFSQKLTSNAPTIAALNSALKLAAQLHWIVAGPVVARVADWALPADADYWRNWNIAASMLAAAFGLVAEDGVGQVDVV